MFDRSNGFSDLIGVLINTLQPPFLPNISSHVWVKSKAENVSIPANVKVYDEGIS